MTICPVIEPATEDVLAQVAMATSDEVDDAVGQAGAAQVGWRALAPAQRARLLAAIGDGIEHNLEHLAELEARNVGMPIADARAVVAGAADTFRFYAASPQRHHGQTIPVAGGVNMTFPEPLGVVGVITPWNFPLAIAAWKIAPALAAGNGVVHKPSELTPLTAIELQRIATQVGLPSDLFRVVVGDGPGVGQQLVDHPKVRKIAFTGSTAVGRAIAASAARDIKRVSLELGGKSASIIFADANLDDAVQGLAGGVFGNAGQDCCARSRVFVERPVLDEFLERLESVVREIRVGDPLSAVTTMGPLISDKQRRRVSELISKAPIAFQGEVPSGPGFWFPPTVLHPIDDNDPAAREEIFGPVVSVLAFDREDEVVTRVNESIYGLAGSIWATDGARALRVARAVEAGALAINSYTSVRLGVPFGGFKQSGIGRELGAAAVDEYTDLKSVFFAT